MRFKVGKSLNTQAYFHAQNDLFGNFNDLFALDFPVKSLDLLNRKNQPIIAYFFLIFMANC